MGHGPLTGYKILDLTQFEAGTSHGSEPKSGRLKDPAEESSDATADFIPTTTPTDSLLLT